MIRRPPRSTHCISSAASDVYKRQVSTQSTWGPKKKENIVLSIKEMWTEKNIIKTEPQFITLDEIEPGKHGYNVYVKILEIEVEEIQKNKVYKGVCGDKTAKIKFIFPGKYDQIIKPNVVIAIRNGLSCVEKEKHVLKVDKFGKLTEEKDIDIGQVNETKDKSKDSYEIKVVRRPEQGNLNSNETQNQDSQNYDRSNNKQRGGFGYRRGGRYRSYGNSYYRGKNQRTNYDSDQGRQYDRRSNSRQNGLQDKQFDRKPRYQRRGARLQNEQPYYQPKAVQSKDQSKQENKQ
eukprot:TRINITY_DN4506_c0_g1_i1.p2 TRINITY_DN4506_c0_g1~~TRINITY_DN4506_c0_g1_i1.p2  ORF type:complete len:290 (-),score=72.76 TRINITY_DN4506_c0_g1_i1:189-1058(-)